MRSLDKLYFTTDSTGQDRVSKPNVSRSDSLSSLRRLDKSLVQTGIVTAQQISRALDLQRASRPSIGNLAIEMQYLTAQDVNTILQWQKVQNQWLFGEIAIGLGYLSDIQVENLLSVQVTRTQTLSQILHEMGVLN